MCEHRVGMTSRGLDIYYLPGSLYGDDSTVLCFCRTTMSGVKTLIEKDIILRDWSNATCPEVILGKTGQCPQLPHFHRQGTGTVQDSLNLDGS